MAKGKYEYWLTPDGLLKLEAWARDGLTDEQIALKIGITSKTLYEWKNRYSEICESLKKGKEVVDILVENALLKRALGYEYNETTRERNETGELKVTKVVTKEVVPDTTAQIFWLKNRAPDKWRDKPKSLLDVEEQTARIKQMQAETERLNRDAYQGEDDVADDGFIAALGESAANDWSGDET